jgi:hypothetical protein
MFQGRYITLDRKFHSPLGKFGVYYATCVFVIAFVSSAFFQDDSFVSLSIVLGFVGMATVYYFAVVASSQIITNEEFRMNVINANFRRRYGSIFDRGLKLFGLRRAYHSAVRFTLKKFNPIKIVPDAVEIEKTTKLSFVETITAYISSMKNSSEYESLDMAASENQRRLTGDSSSIYQEGNAPIELVKM